MVSVRGYYLYPSLPKTDVVPLQALCTEADKDVPKQSQNRNATEAIGIEFSVPLYLSESYQPWLTLLTKDLSAVGLMH
eukprot:2669722-Amphidinium_carterae.1